MNRSILGSIKERQDDSVFLLGSLILPVFSCLVSLSLSFYSRTQVLSLFSSCPVILRTSFCSTCMSVLLHVIIMSFFVYSVNVFLWYNIFWQNAICLLQVRVYLVFTQIHWTDSRDGSDSTSLTDSKSKANKSMKRSRLLLWEKHIEFRRKRKTRRVWTEFPRGFKPTLHLFDQTFELDEEYDEEASSLTNDTDLAFPVHVTHSVCHWPITQALLHSWGTKRETGKEIKRM